jgi:hypothetical protein
MSHDMMSMLSEADVENGRKIRFASPRIPILYHAFEHLHVTRQLSQPISCTIQISDDTRARALTRPSSESRGEPARKHMTPVDERAHPARLSYGFR